MEESLKPLIIAIAGGTGSGKSTFAQLLKEKVPIGTVIVSQDMYYKDQSSLPLEERLLSNMDTPEALDINLLCQDLKLLLEEKPIHRPTYNFSDHTRSVETVAIPPTPVVIIEGIFAFATEQLRWLTGLEIYLEVDDDLRLARRIMRDVREKRNGSLEGALNQYLTSARPMHKMFVEPQRVWADIIINWNDRKPDAVDVVAAKIKQHLISHD